MTHCSQTQSLQLQFSLNLIIFTIFLYVYICIHIFRNWRKIHEAQNNVFFLTNNVKFGNFPSQSGWKTLACEHPVWLMLAVKGSEDLFYFKARPNRRCGANNRMAECLIVPKTQNTYRASGTYRCLSMREDCRSWYNVLLLAKRYVKDAQADGAMADWYFPTRCLCECVFLFGFDSKLGSESWRTWHQ